MKSHLKKLTVPTTWSVLRGDRTFITRPNPGSHQMEFGLSLNTLLKDVLGIARTTKEVKFMLQSKYVMVDGKYRYDQKYMVGLFDVVSILPSDEHYMITLDNRRKLKPLLITKTEAKAKIARVAKKTYVSGGKVQINTNDGRCFLVNKGEYKIGDTVYFTVPEQEIKKKFSVEKGKLSLLVKGRHRGIMGTLEEVDNDYVVIKDENNEMIKTKREYVFVLGDDKPVVKVRE